MSHFLDHLLQRLLLFSFHFSNPLLFHLLSNKFKLKLELLLTPLLIKISLFTETKKLSHILLELLPTTPNMELVPLSLLTMSSRWEFLDSSSTRTSIPQANIPQLPCQLETHLVKLLKVISLNTLLILLWNLLSLLKTLLILLISFLN